MQNIRQISPPDIFRTFYSFSYFSLLCRLLLLECRTCGTVAVAGAAALDIHMIRMTFVIGIIDAFYRFAVNADGLAGMNHGAFKGTHPLPLLKEALAAGVVAIAGMFSAHHNIPFAAQAILIVGTILYAAF